MRVVFDDEDEESLQIIAAQFDVPADYVGVIVGRKLWILMDLNRAWLVGQVRAELRAMSQVSRAAPSKKADVPSGSRKSRKVSEPG